MTARETILRRIHTALRDVPNAERAADVAVARDYLTSDSAPHAQIVADFAERVAEYKATVEHVGAADLPAAIAVALQAQGITKLVVPDDVPDAWLPDSVTVLHDHGQLTHQELDASDGVLTACALGIAQTGTIVLDHGAQQGRRAITLVPDYHLCIVRADQIVGLMPEAITALAPAARAGRPITMISGPSATSDIELSRVEGVHGPRTLHVLVVS